MFSNIHRVCNVRKFKLLGFQVRFCCLTTVFTMLLISLINFKVKASPAYQQGWKKRQLPCFLFS